MNLLRDFPEKCPKRSVSSADGALDRSTLPGRIVRTWSTRRPRAQHRGDRPPDTAMSESGAVFVEFLIAFFPVYVFFLCLIQLTLLFSSRLVTEHAAVHAARAAILTLAPLILTGLVQDVEVILPEPDVVDGPPQPDGFTYTAMGETEIQKVRVRVEVRIACRIGFANKIACPDDSLTLSSLLFGLRTRRVRAEAIYPYQGARYD